ncbi:MAG: hypothetical protein JO018_01270 [Candidatus Eremiobacteraeota bacterium]|nr:hypothetical protein [Candidatus Eremiobacteraeota bacterium]
MPFLRLIPQGASSKIKVMKVLLAAIVVAALAVTADTSARADQGPVWWVVQQNILQQQAQAAAQNALARQQITQGMQRQLDLQSLNLQSQAGALETQRTLNALQIQGALNQQIDDFRYIQNLQLLQIMQSEINAANYGVHKKAVPKKSASKTKPRG